VRVPETQTEVIGAIPLLGLAAAANVPNAAYMARVAKRFIECSQWEI